MPSGRFSFRYFSRRSISDLSLLVTVIDSTEVPSLAVTHSIDAITSPNPCFSSASSISAPSSGARACGSILIATIVEIVSETMPSPPLIAIVP